MEQRWDAGGGERKVEKAHLETGGIIKDMFIRYGRSFWIIILIVIG